MDKIKICAEVVNRTIAEMLAEENDAIGYYTQFNIIKSAFVQSHSIELQKEDIARRLALLDLFYTTNFNRFAEFGIDDLTDAIWNLTQDSNGKHSDSVLVEKVETFVSNCCNPTTHQLDDNPIFESFFAPSAVFGISMSAGKLKGYAAQSLISKYLFFLLESHHSENNTFGFPIFDSIAKELQEPLIKKLGGKNVIGCGMIEYVARMKVLLDCLKDSCGGNRTVWNMPSSVCNTQFGLLDYFLWRVGKCGRFSFSLLWSKVEKRNHYFTAEKLKGDTEKGMHLNLTDFNALPSRFQKWHIIYHSIKD